MLEDVLLPPYTVKLETDVSGGQWWLSDEQWRALESDGWQVDWIERTLPRSDATEDEGTIAMSAYLHNTDIDAAMERFAKATGADPFEIGCPCCGYPFEFVVPVPQQTSAGKSASDQTAAN